MKNLLTKAWAVERELRRHPVLVAIVFAVMAILIVFELLIIKRL